MKALSLKLGEWKETQRGTGGSGLKGSFKTRATDGNKGWGVEEITTQNKSLPMKQYFLHGPFQESFISMVFSAWLCSFMEDIRHVEGFLVAQMVKVSANNVGDSGSIPVLGRSPGEGNGNPLQYSCLENPMDRGAW